MESANGLSPLKRGIDDGEFTNLDQRRVFFRVQCTRGTLRAAQLPLVEEVEPRADLEIDRA